MGWKACLGCCGTGDKTQDDQENIIAQEEAEEVDEQYVFLEQFPTDRRVENPNVPFIGELPVPMGTGRVVELDGKVLPDATRFSLNLVCGDKPTADLAFHFNPRFDQNYVARNSRLSGRWGHEESLSSQRNPFKRGQKFHIVILSSEDEFMVAVNGIHFCSYAYRTVPIKIQSVQINGDVTVNTLEYHMTEKYPEIPPIVRSPFINITSEDPLSNSIKGVVKLPLLARLPQGINIGEMLEIVGRTKLLPHSYAANEFMTAEHCGTHLDAPYHFFREGWKVGDIPVSKLIVPAVLMDMTDEVNGNPDFELKPNHIKIWEEQHGELPEESLLLIRYGWGRYYNNRTQYFGFEPRSPRMHFPGMAADAAEFLKKQRNLVGVGVDTPSVDCGKSSIYSAHIWLQGDNMYILENLDLGNEEIPDTDFTVIVMPMKITQGTGAPARVVAMINSSTTAASAFKAILLLVTMIGTMML